MKSVNADPWSFHFTLKKDFPEAFRFIDGFPAYTIMRTLKKTHDALLRRFAVPPLFDRQVLCGPILSRVAEQQSGYDKQHGEEGI